MFEIFMKLICRTHLVRDWFLTSWGQQPSWQPSWHPSWRPSWGQPSCQPSWRSSWRPSWRQPSWEQQQQRLYGLYKVNWLAIKIVVFEIMNSPARFNLTSSLRFDSLLSTTPYTLITLLVLASYKLWCNHWLILSFILFNDLGIVW